MMMHGPANVKFKCTSCVRLLYQLIVIISDTRWLAQLKIKDNEQEVEKTCQQRIQNPHVQCPQQSQPNNQSFSESRNTDCRNVRNTVYN